MADDWEFYRHMPVFQANGRRLGFVNEVGHAVDYLHVQQGRVLVRDWYVPLSLVRDVTRAGVVLTLNVKELQSRRYNVPPVEYLSRQGATPGYEYTSKADIPRYGETESPATAEPA